MKKIYLITDESLSYEMLFNKTKEALEARIDYLQYRVKNKLYVNKREEALELRRLCHKYRTKFIINDDLTLALEVGADGVHIGQEDMELSKVRTLVPKEFIIGVTAKTVIQAKEAIKGGANYLGVGAIYESKTKVNVIRITREILEQIHTMSPIPIYGIGGLTPYNITDTIRQYVDGVCFVSSIYQSNNIKETIQDIRRQIGENHV